MISRMLIAIVGALVITTGLLLGMDAVTSVFRERSTTKMYRISDVVRRDRSGRPDMPEPPTRLPALPDIDPAGRSNPGIAAEAPAAPAASVPGFDASRVLLDPEADTADSASED